MKNLLFTVLILATTVVYSQGLEKKYEYIIVPNQYEFTSEPNQFQINVLTRVMLKEEGFKVYMSEGEEKPNELTENQCLALRANVTKDGGLFTTVLIFQLRDCFGKTIFKSEGKSRKKAYKDAYQEALREALGEFQSVSSNYLKSENEEEQQKAIAPSAKIEKPKNIPFEDQADTYQNEDKTFWLLKKNENYILYLDKGKTIFATLDLADRGTYAYDSEKIDGAAYFNANGDIIVEYLAKNKDNVQKLIFKKK